MTKNDKIQNLIFEAGAVLAKMNSCHSSSTGRFCAGGGSGAAGGGSGRAGSGAIGAGSGGSKLKHQEVDAVPHPSDPDLKIVRIGHRGRVYAYSVTKPLPTPDQVRNDFKTNRYAFTPWNTSTGKFRSDLPDSSLWGSAPSGRQRPK